MGIEAMLLLLGLGIGVAWSPMPAKAEPVVCPPVVRPAPPRELMEPPSPAAMELLPPELRKRALRSSSS